MRLFSFVVALAATVLFSPLAQAELKVGDQAPGFSLAGSDGKTHDLANYGGKKVVVLAWFPKAFTGG